MERRTEQVNVGLSPVEIATVKEKASKAGLPLGSFMRAAGLGHRLTVVESIAPDFMTRHELRRIGSNLNQIAHALNSGETADTDTLSSCLDKLDRLFDLWLSHDPQSREARP